MYKAQVVIAFFQQVDQIGGRARLKPIIAEVAEIQSAQ